MRSKPRVPELEQLREIYDDVELAILFDWLGHERPEPLRQVQFEMYEENEYPEEAAGRVRLMRSEGGYSDRNALSNAVARLVLSEIQGRLPQWGVAYEDGRVALARTYAPRRDANVGLLPRFLFEINWADSGPGFSWPEAYHVTYLPGFDRYVVTASQDSPEMHGYTDEAIGHFPAAETVKAGAHRAIVDWWRGQAEAASQHCWECLFRSGDVDAETAHSWANEVWDAGTGEPLSWGRGFGSGT